MPTQFSLSSRSRPSSKPKLLIVEDEEAILHGLKDLFTFNGYEVDSRSDGKEGLECALSGGHDGVILDVMLPTMDGFTICEEIRKSTRELPIIMLTAKQSEEDIINGLTLGADDYIAKPFSVRELVLRVDSVLRRAGIDKNQRELRINDDLTIDLDNLVSVSSDSDGKSHSDTNGKNDRKILFTRREIDLLLFLKKNQHRPSSRTELLAEVWGYKKNADIDTRTVDIHIAKLRKKIETTPKKPNLLLTIRGEGYKLAN
ncbi:MAG: response regulator transcription factor [Pseudomonadales bacterium]|nr:response regulator transcription factor [Pseudomonadales bacterium]